MNSLTDNDEAKLSNCLIFVNIDSKVSIRQTRLHLKSIANAIDSLKRITYLKMPGAVENTWCAYVSCIFEKGAMNLLNANHSSLGEHLYVRRLTHQANEHFRPKNKKRGGYGYQVGQPKPKKNLKKEINKTKVAPQ